MSYSLIVHCPFKNQCQRSPRIPKTASAIGQSHVSLPPAVTKQDRTQIIRYFTDHGVIASYQSFKSISTPHAFVQLNPF